MVKIEAALVVDGSSVAREVLARLLGVRAKRVEAVGDVGVACALLRSESPWTLVLVDAATPGGGAEALLEGVRAMEDGRPAVLVLTGRHDLEEEARASLGGAVGYLTKPITVRDLAAAIKGLEGPSLQPAAARTTGTPVALAWVLDRESGDRAAICWEVRDLSRSGAFLLTHAPIPTGTRLRLRIQLDSGGVVLDAEVVRVQEPRWGVLPGVAVAFRYPSAAHRERLDRHVGTGRSTLRN